MAFGVRRSKVDIPAKTAFYACPFCKEVFTDKKAYRDHVNDHKADMGKLPE